MPNGKRHVSSNLPTFLLVGRGPNIWDHFIQNNRSVIDGKETAEVACDSYHKYKDDVRILKERGADFYRFSISWSRVLPTGRISDEVNRKGLLYYNALINELDENGIEPVVTMYHWDLPQALQQEDGGWLNESTTAHFAEYARLLYGNLGDRVKKWVTFNEPSTFCELGYDIAVYAPGIRGSPTGAYLCAHNVLKAHALAYRIYEKEFRAVQKGQIGISIDSGWYEPEDPSKPEDVVAAGRAIDFKVSSIIFPPNFLRGKCYVFSF